MAAGVDADGVFVVVIDHGDGGDEGVYVDDVDDFFEVGEGFVCGADGAPPWVPDHDEAVFFFGGYVEVVSLVFECDVAFFVFGGLAADFFEDADDEVFGGDVVEFVFGHVFDGFEFSTAFVEEAEYEEDDGP